MATYYSSNLALIDGIDVPFINADYVHVFNQYTVKAKDRNSLVNYLNEKGIPTMIYYPLPLHLQVCFKYLGYKKGDFPEAENVSDQVLSLPLYPELKKEEQDLIIKNVRNFYEQEI